MCFAKRERERERKCLKMRKNTKKYSIIVINRPIDRSVDRSFALCIALYTYNSVWLKRMGIERRYINDSMSLSAGFLCSCCSTYVCSPTLSAAHCLSTRVLLLVFLFLFRNTHSIYLWYAYWVRSPIRLHTRAYLLNIHYSKSLFVILQSNTIGVV